MGRSHRRGMAAAAVLAVLGLTTACAATATSGGDEAESPAGGSPSEAGGVTGRVAVAVEGGLVVLEPDTLEVAGEFDSEEFTRLNAFGDGRNVLVTMSEGFQVLDTGGPALRETVFRADTAGHVVRHGGKTVLFDDGTGDTTVVETDALGSGEELPDTEVTSSPEAHHGVSIVLDDGTLLTTIGDAESRTGVRAIDENGEEIARSEDCPGVHGEGTAADEAVVFGCEDGALLYHHGEFEKLTAPDEYGRMGNAYVSESSPIVVGDYKNDPDAEGYLLDMVTLIDTAAHTSEVVELPEGVEYTFRDVVRGPGDDAYILSTDGSIHVLNPQTGEMVESFPVVEPWEGPAEWQDPHPAITANGDIAYVTEPAADTVHAVDLTTGETIASQEIPGTPNEIAVALG